MKSKRILFLIMIAIGILAYGAMGLEDNEAESNATTTLIVGGQLSPRCPADTIVAVPVFKGDLAELSLRYSKTVSVKPKGGKFRLILDKNSDWLLVLMDSTVTGSNQFVGMIAYPTGNPHNTLLLLPVSKAKTSRLELGRLRNSGNLWLARTSLNPRKFSLTLEQLLFLADYDDLFMNVKNLLLNSHTLRAATTGTYYILRPDFSWFGNYAETQNAFMAPNWHAYRSYNFQLDSDSTEVTMDQICGANGVAKVLQELYPPVGAIVESKNPSFVYNDQFPISNNNATCTPTPDGFIEAKDEDFFATNRYTNISYTFGVNLVTNPIPLGYWRYLVGGIQRALFDVAVAQPVAPEGQVNGLTPVLRINTNGSGQITSIDISWYAFNTTTQTYDVVTDLSMLEHLIGSANIFLENQATNSRSYESISFVPETETNVRPTNTWYFGNTGTVELQADGIGVFYSSAGIGFFFQLTKFVYPQGAPSFILPLPEATLPQVTKGQQYNSCFNNIRHTGLDFGFDPSTNGSFLYYDIIAPGDGLVMQVRSHPIGSNVGVDVGFLHNHNWGTFVAFEPFSADQQIAILQLKDISVFVNQVVKKGDTIGRLIVPQTEFPHIHWQVYSIDPNTWSTTDLCPRLYSSPQAQDQLDELYGNSQEGIIGRLPGPGGQPFQDACLPTPPPECITPE